MIFIMAESYKSSIYLREKATVSRVESIPKNISSKKKMRNVIGWGTQTMKKDHQPRVGK